MLIKDNQNKGLEDQDADVDNENKAHHFDSILISTEDIAIDEEGSVVFDVGEGDINAIDDSDDSDED